jgi:hypothetical protein
MEGDSVSENATVASYVGKSSWTRWRTVLRVHEK